MGLSQSESPAAIALLLVPGAHLSSASGTLAVDTTAPGDRGPVAQFSSLLVPPNGQQRIPLDLGDLDGLGKCCFSGAEGGC